MRSATLLLKGWKWWTFSVVLVITLIYLIFCMQFAICDTYDPRLLAACSTQPSTKWLVLSLADKGQYIGGIFTPVAFVWFIVGVWLQQQELELVRIENRAMSQANDEQAKALIVAGRAAGRQMVLTLLDKSHADTAENLLSAAPVIEELKKLSRIYPSLVGDVQDTQDLIPSGVLQLCMIINIFKSNDTWRNDVIEYHRNSPQERARFESCVISLDFFMRTIVERYDQLRQLAYDSLFIDVFETHFSHNEERLLYEECKKWLLKDALDVTPRG